MENYTSQFSGQHNDDYDERIAILDGKITSLEDQVTSLESTITTLTSTLTSLNTKVEKYRNKPSGQKKWGTVTLSSGSTSQTISLTTTGRPVLLICSGDNNPGNNAWGWLGFWRNGTQLSMQIFHDPGSSTNRPFCQAYLDMVGAGTYTYEARITHGSGEVGLSENGAIEAPVFLAFEI